MSSFFQEDDDLGFWENMGQDEQPAETPEAEAAPEDEGTPAAEEVVAEEAPAVEADTAEEVEDGRPRDDKGRFLPKDKQETAAEAEQRLLAGKYKSPEELEQAYAELQARFGSQGSELGELRRAVEERFGQLEQTLNRPQAPSSWDDLIEENPAQAVALAYQHGDEFNLRRAAQAWEEVSPGAPALWAENIKFRAEMESKLAEIDQRTKPVVQQTEDQARARAYLNVKSRHPDIEQQIDAMRAVAVNYPIAVKAIESGTPEEAEQGWETLYSLAKAGTADTLRETAQQVARNVREGEERVRGEAVVASATTVPAEKPKTMADRIGDEWDEIESPLAAGWNI